LYAYDGLAWGTMHLAAILAFCEYTWNYFLQEQPVSMEVWNQKLKFLYWSFCH
jgi:hypothetical protein